MVNQTFLLNVKEGLNLHYSYIEESLPPEQNLHPKCQRGSSKNLTLHAPYINLHPKCQRRSVTERNGPQQNHLPNFKEGHYCTKCHIDPQQHQESLDNKLLYIDPFN